MSGTHSNRPSNFPQRFPDGANSSTTDKQIIVSTSKYYGWRYVKSLTGTRTVYNEFVAAPNGTMRRLRAESYVRDPKRRRYVRHCMVSSLKPCFKVLSLSPTGPGMVFFPRWGRPESFPQVNVAPLCSPASRTTAVFRCLRVPIETVRGRAGVRETS